MEWRPNANQTIILSSDHSTGLLTKFVDAALAELIGT